MHVQACVCTCAKTAFLRFLRIVLTTQLAVRKNQTLNLKIGRLEASPSRATSLDLLDAALSACDAQAGSCGESDPKEIDNAVEGE